MYDQFGNNTTVANLTNWFVDRPARIAVVVLAAFVLTALARRWVRRFTTRLLTPKGDGLARLGKLGAELSEAIEPAEPDPRRAARAESASAVLTSTTIVAIWVIAALTILGVVGIQLGPLLAGAGVAGVAIGFGAQSLVKDCIAGLFMLIEDQYGIGDVVDLGEASGVVEEISLRVTVLRGIDGTVWHVPNGVVQRVGNRSQVWSVAVLDVDVAYDTDLNQARTMMQRAADELFVEEEFADNLIDPPTVLGIESLGADGITLRLTTKVQPGTQWAVQRALRERIKSTFDAAGIEIPFPQRTVWVRNDSDPSRPEGRGAFGS